MKRRIFEAFRHINNQLSIQCCLQCTYMSNISLFCRIWHTLKSSIWLAQPLDDSVLFLTQSFSTESKLTHYRFTLMPDSHITGSHWCQIYTLQVHTDAIHTLQVHTDARFTHYRFTLMPDSHITGSPWCQIHTLQVHTDARFTHNRFTLMPDSHITDSHWWYSHINLFYSCKQFSFQL
jgi:allantoicase